MADHSYHRDIAAWSMEQARRIRAGQFDQLDLDHIADEIEDVGKSERRELESRMAVLLAHLIKCQFQPDRRGSSWDRTIREQRKQVRRKLEQVPSLTPLLRDGDWLEGVWGDAIVLALHDAALDGLPEACPWPVTSVLDESWLPASVPP